MRLLLEVDDDLRQLLRHALAGCAGRTAARPAPWISTRRATKVSASLSRFACSSSPGSPALPLPSLKPAVYCPRTTREASCSAGIGSRARRPDLLVANAVRRKVAGRIHGDQAEQLQQVVLHHVAQLPGLVEVAPAAFDADLLGHGDLHVGDVVLVPLGLEEAVGEAQGDQVPAPPPLPR